MLCETCVICLLSKPFDIRDTFAKYFSRCINDKVDLSYSRSQVRGINDGFGSHSATNTKNIKIKNVFTFHPMSCSVCICKKYEIHIFFFTRKYEIYDM